MATFAVNPEKLLEKIKPIVKDASEKYQQHRKKEARFERKYAWAVTTIHNRKLFKLSKWKVTDTERRLFSAHVSGYSLDRRARSKHGNLGRSVWLWNDYSEKAKSLARIARAAIASGKNDLRLDEENLIHIIKLAREYPELEEITG